MLLEQLPGFGAAFNTEQVLVRYSEGSWSRSILLRWRYLARTKNSYPLASPLPAGGYADM